MTLEQALRARLEQTPGLTLDYIEKVLLGAELEPGKIECVVWFQSKWQVPISYSAEDVKRAEGVGYARAVELMRQTGRTELADEMERAWPKK